MKAVKFYSTRTSPKPPCLPQGFLEGLPEEIRRLREPLYIPCQGISEILRGEIEASGLGWEELCERMRKPGDETEITPQYLDKVLAQNSPENSPEMWLQLRIFKALHIQWDDFSRMVEAKNEMGFKACDRIGAHVEALRSYAKYGPHLFGLFKAEERSPYFDSSQPPELRQLNMRLEKDPFNPPSAEAVGHAIAKHLATRAPQADNERDAVAAYRYHRLPNEFHDFDLKGNLLASGDSSMDAPPGLTVIEIYTPGRFVRIVVPPALLQKYKTRIIG